MQREERKHTAVTRVTVTCNHSSGPRQGRIFPYCMCSHRGDHNKTGRMRQISGSKPALTFYFLTLNLAHSVSLPISPRVTLFHPCFVCSCCGDQRSLFCQSQSPVVLTWIQASTLLDSDIQTH